MDQTKTFFRLLLSTPYGQGLVETPRELSRTFVEIMEEPRVDVAVMKFRVLIEQTQGSLPQKRNWMDGGYIAKERIDATFVNALRFGLFVKNDPNSGNREDVGRLQIKSFMMVTKVGGLKLETVYDLVQGWLNFALVLTCVEERPLSRTTPDILSFLKTIIELLWKI